MADKFQRKIMNGIMLKNYLLEKIKKFIYFYIKKLVYIKFILLNSILVNFMKFYYF